MASAFVITAAAKLSRSGPDRLGPGRPAWLVGVLPNFVCGAAVPLAAFLSPRVLRPREYGAFVALVLVGLCGYEAAQLWLPRRTFDTDDLLASGAGALVALVVGAGLFVATRRPP